MANGISGELWWPGFRVTENPQVGNSSCPKSALFQGRQQPFCKHETFLETFSVYRRGGLYEVELSGYVEIGCGNSGRVTGEET